METRRFFQTTVVDVWMTKDFDEKELSDEVVKSDFGTIYFCFENAAMPKIGDVFDTGDWSVQER